MKSEKKRKYILVFLLAIFSVFQSESEIFAKHVGRSSSDDYYSEETRKKISRTNESPYNAIGLLKIKLENGKKYTGTGTLISPIHVLTAAHVVHDRDFKGEKIASIKFIPGKNGPGRSKKEETYGRYEIDHIRFPKNWEKKEKYRSPKEENEENDFALLTLTEKIPDNIHWLDFGSGYSKYIKKHNKKVYMAGYAGEKEGKYEHTLWNGKTRKVKISHHSISYKMLSSGGQSGGPVFIYKKNDDDIPLIIGVNTNGHSYKAKGYGRYLNRSIGNCLEDWMREDGWNAVEDEWIEDPSDILSSESEDDSNLDELGHKLSRLIFRVGRR